MMKIRRSSTFKQDFKRYKRKHFDMSKVEKVILHLINRDKDTLVNQYKDHQLKGVLKDYRELHIESDWLLIYKINNHELELYLMTMGSHDEIFRKAKDINS